MAIPHLLAYYWDACRPLDSRQFGRFAAESPARYVTAPVEEGAGDVAQVDTTSTFKSYKCLIRSCPYKQQEKLKIFVNSAYRILGLNQLLSKEKMARILWSSVMCNTCQCSLFCEQASRSCT